MNCAEGRFFEGSSCVRTCTSNRFPNTATGTCDDCNSRCATCFGATQDECFTCASGLLFYQNSCLFSCPEGTVQGVGTCVDAETCDHDQPPQSTIMTQQRGETTFSASTPSIVEALCALGPIQSNDCVVGGAELRTSVTAQFTISASVQCLLSAIDPTSSTLTSAAVNYLRSNSAEMQSLYSQANSLFVQELDAASQAICSGSVTQGTGFNELPQETVTLASLGDGTFSASSSRLP